MIIRKAYADTPAGQVHYRHAPGASGRAPLVFLHRTPASSATFEAMMRAISGDRPVYAFDTPGFGGDVEHALASIRAHVLYLPGETDMYFPITDAEYERTFLRDVDFRPIPSVWGHMAGSGPTPEERGFLNEAIREALAR